MSSETTSTNTSTTLDSGVRIVGATGEGLDLPSPWAPVKISKDEIAATVAELVAAPKPANGRRVALIVHPESNGRGLAPGIEVSVEVLLPGESTFSLRRNSSLVEIGIAGQGRVVVAGTTIDLARHDVCNIPSMKPHRFENPGDDVWVRLSYSNAPLLATLGTHYYEVVGDDWAPAVSVDGPIDMDEPGDISRGSAPDYELVGGGRLRGYEHLVDIEPVPNRPLHWPYSEMSTLMSQEPGDTKRTIMALYNPATERKQGATNSFFVTLTQIPAGPRRAGEGPGHRHSSVAINYHFEGTGYSVVDGQRIDWEAGDLLLSAPSWREHAHYPTEERLSVYTVQDHPLHIGMESLIWQEDLDGPILALGLEPGQTGYVAPRNWDDQ